MNTFQHFEIFWVSAEPMKKESTDPNPAEFHPHPNPPPTFSDNGYVKTVKAIFGNHSLSGR
jgi:hypothetical protein